MTVLWNLYQKSTQNIKSDTFCESFFLASFPTKNGKIIERGTYEELMEVDGMNSTRPSVLLMDFLAQGFGLGGLSMLQEEP